MPPFCPPEGGKVKNTRKKRPRSRKNAGIPTDIFEGMLKTSSFLTSPFDSASRGKQIFNENTTSASAGHREHRAQSVEHGTPRRTVARHGMPGIERRAGRSAGRDYHILRNSAATSSCVGTRGLVAVVASASAAVAISSTAAIYSPSLMLPSSDTRAGIFISLHIKRR